MNADETLERAQALVDRIRPLMAGAGADVQGAALVQLVALHLAGHPPEQRHGLLTLHARCVRDLVPAVEREIFGQAGHPARGGS
jgi:hypothetical protein